MNSFWDTIFWGNSIKAYVIVVTGMVLAWIVIRIFKKYVLKQIKLLTSRTQTNFDDLAYSASEKFLLPWVYLFVNYQFLQQLNLSVRVEKVLQVAMAVVTMYYVIRIINHILHVTITGIMRRRGESEFRMTQLNGALLLLKGLVWAGGLIFLVDNLGYNVTTMIAGLGVGGIAIALAAQAVLGDLFSYFVIFFDKPFEIGDYIVMGDKSGHIEHIGIKTTRVRSLGGELLIMPNTDLTKLTVSNFKSLQQRREVLQLRVTYETPHERLERIPKMVEEIIRSKNKTKFDRAHLSLLGEYSIGFEVVYLILTADYGEYMNVRQAVLQDIIAVFAKEKISFAYPTQRSITETTMVS